jgi:hypothetical protein
VNGVSPGGLDRTHFIDRFSNNIHHSSKRSLADGNRNGSAQIFRGHPAHHAVRGLHRNAPHAAFAKVLLYLGNDVHGRFHIKSLRSNTKCLIDRRKIILKFDVNDRPDDLYNLPDLYVSVISHF